MSMANKFVLKYTMNMPIKNECNREIILLLLFYLDKKDVCLK